MRSMFELESDGIVIVEAFLNLNLRIHKSFSVINILTVLYELGQQVLCTLFSYKESSFTGPYRLLLLHYSFYS